MAHRFRFFVDEPGSAGAVLPLAKGDARHLRVLRAPDGTAVEVVDVDHVLWSATVAGDGTEALLAERSDRSEPIPRIVLYAGVLAGQRWDELVDGATQAGAAEIVPVAATAREAGRIVERQARAERIARAASKQAKRLVVPTIAEPVLLPDLDGRGPGFVLATGSDHTLAAALAEGHPPGAGALRLLVGPAEGLAEDVVTGLVTVGWTRVGLGPTVLRAELAAAVAVATAAQLTQRPEA